MKKLGGKFDVNVAACQKRAAIALRNARIEERSEAAKKAKPDWRYLKKMLCKVV